MIEVGDNLRAAIESYDVTAVSFITLSFTKTNTYQVTEAPYDITVGNETYSSANNLAGISAPGAQNSVDRDNYTLSFNDNDQAMRIRFAQESGVPLSVKLGFVNSEGDLVTDGDGNIDLLDVYAGNSSAVSFKPQGDGYVTEVGFTGQLTQLDSNKTLSTTPQSQRQINSSDTSMKYAHNGTNDDAIKWGRKD